MTAPKRILLAGAATGAHWNIGDEAILAAMVRQLRGIDPAVRIAAASANPPGSLAAHGVEEVPYDSIAGVVAAAGNADLLLLGGGGLFFDYWDFARGELLTPRHAGLTFYAGFAMLARLLRKPLMIYAAGVGPLATDEGRRLARAAFELATIVTVRDAGSRDLLTEIGIDPTRVAVTADPAFALGEPEAGAVEAILEPLGGERMPRPLVAVAIRQWPVESPGAWERELAGALDAFLDRHGGTILFVPFHREAGGVSDEAASARVAESMRNRAMTAALAAGHPAEAIAGVIARCDLVVAMRLHALLFAQSRGVPALALRYDPKVAGAVNAQHARYALGLGELSAGTAAALLGEMLARRDEIAAELRAAAAARHEAANENARMAGALLRSGAPAGERDLSPSTRALFEELALRQIRRSVELEETIGRLEAVAAQRDEGIEWLRGEVRLRDRRIEDLVRAGEEPLPRRSD